MAVLRGDLAALAEQARQAGLTVRGWLGEAELGGIIRGAYDPDTTLDPAIDPGANLTRAGPVAISEAWAHFRHDSGWTRCCGSAEWPREDVPPDFLHSLVFAPGVRRTLSLICRPLPADKARRRIRRARTQALADRHQKQKMGQLTDLSDDQEYQDLLDREAGHQPGPHRYRLRRADHRHRRHPDRPGGQQPRSSGPPPTRPATCPGTGGQQTQGFVAGALPLGRSVSAGVPVSDRVPAAADPPEGACARPP